MSFVCLIFRSALILFEKMFPKLCHIRLSIFWFRGQRENLILIFVCHRFIDLVYCDLEHLYFIDDVKYFVFFFRRLLLLNFCHDLFANTACSTNFGCRAIVI